MALPEPPTYDVHELERRARDFLREYLGTEVAIPVDIDFLIEKLPGVDLDYWPALRANHQLDGMIMRDPQSGDLFVYIDEHIADTQPNRYRMTVAEELGHLLLHRKLIDQVASPNDFAKLQQHHCWHEMERNAKRFAAAVLMPGDAVTSHAEHCYKQLVAVAGFGDVAAILRYLAARLAQSFEVSPQSMGYRLREWPMQLTKRIEESMRNRLDFLG